MRPDKNEKTAGITRFDIAIGMAALILLAGIGATVLAGDRAGVGAQLVSPLDMAHTTALIRIAFNEAMDTASVEAGLQIEPPVAGQITWAGYQLTLKPALALAPGRYTISLHRGIMSTQGRRLVEDVAWTVDIIPSQVIYLAPAVRETNSPPPNLWVIDKLAAHPARQITFSTTGVTSFQASPDGTQVAFSQRAQDGTSDLYIVPVDVAAGSAAEPRRITHCVGAICQEPAWSPDGSRIAYERIELNKDIQSLDAGAARPWIVTLKDLSTAPVFSDSQLLGSQPRWSPDGTQLLVHDKNLNMLIMYDLATGDRKSVPSPDPVGALDPSGGRLAFLDTQDTPQGFITQISMVDLNKPTEGIRILSDRENTLSDDDQPTWTPDGKAIAITRRDLASRASQVYLLNPDDGTAKPLIVDEKYTHGAISWTPAGDQLVFQRYPYLEDNGQPSIWTYDVKTAQLTQLALNGFAPQWIP